MVDDAQQVAADLRHAVSISGLTQAEFSRALGTSASRFSTYLTGRTMPGAAFYLRTLRLSAALAAANRSGWLTPMQTAQAIGRELIAGDEVRALRMALQGRDDLRSMLERDPTAAQVWELQPGSTGSEVWDRFLSAVAAHEFESHALPRPAWTADVRAGEEWLLDNPFLGLEKVPNDDAISKTSRLWQSR